MTSKTLSLLGLSLITFATKIAQYSIVNDLYDSCYDDFMDSMPTLQEYLDS